MYTVEKQPLKKNKQAPATIQCFRFGKFITSYLTNTAGLGQLSTLASIIQYPSESQNWIDLINPARWRINPLNLYAGLRNGIEESRDGANYHSSSRHGASNSLWNSRDRLTPAGPWAKRFARLPMATPLGGRASDMRDHYRFTGRVDRANTSGRFNSEAWERYAWNRGKRYFEIHAHNAGYNVNWIAGQPPGAGRHNWNAILRMETKKWGSSVGISIGPGAITEVNGVQLAINYCPSIPAPTLSAWNGQMFPVAPPAGPVPLPPARVSPKPVPAHPLPITSLGLYDVPYSFFL